MTDELSTPHGELETAESALDVKLLIDFQLHTVN